VKSEELVRSLVSDLRPVRRLWGVDLRTLLWGGFALLCVGLGTYALGPRVDLASKLRQPSYLLENGSLLLLFALSARGAFRLSIPGLVQNERRRFWPVLGLILWGALIGIRGVQGPHAALSGAAFWLTGVPCVARMGCLGLVPGVAVFFMVRRGAPLHSGWAGLWALVAASALAMLGTQLLCPKDDPLHLLVWHLTPVLLTGLVGAVLGGRFLRGYPIVSAGSRAPA
jgi:hypothetical protein